ncbi:MAG: hypothetical protein JWQ25_1702, partial [Daejeonella sp.]|nr:hypothetical protein [Daejeonella sp.]
MRLKQKGQFLVLEVPLCVPTDITLNQKTL